MFDMNHFDENGNAVMVDVSDKAVSVRTAAAEGFIRTNAEVIEAVVNRLVRKGDVLTVAQVAGIMGAKRTADLIPMCHPLSLTNAELLFEVDESACTIKAFCTVSTEGRTGVEMEALTGVSVALLTVYDMCKALDRRMEIEGIHLVSKTGGRSGEFIF